MSYVFDVIRGSVPRMELDEAFESKDHIANAVKDQLSIAMAEYGYEIVATLVVDLDPSDFVKAAMNDINGTYFLFQLSVVVTMREGPSTHNWFAQFIPSTKLPTLLFIYAASMRMREAASYKADAEKILQVKAAEADGESKYLSGMGVAKQRQAIVEGLRDTVSSFSTEVEGAGPQDVMDLLLVTQYFDMLKDMSARGQGNTVFMPHGPDSVNILRQQLKQGFMSGLNQSHDAKKR